ncbi:MAG: nucleotidyltransferase, partial [Gemmatimonadota bacterium]
MTDFEALLGALVEGGVEFIIVGGVAATVHGSARLTQDIDVVYARTDENMDRLVAALAPFAPYLRGAPAGLPFEWSAATLRRGLNFTLTTTLGDIDLLGEITGGGGYSELSGHSFEVELFGHACACL